MKTAEIISFHPGKQHNLEQAEELVRYFNPVKHITSVAFSKRTINRFGFLPKSVLNELDKRSITTTTAQNVDTYPWLELLFKWKRLTKQAIPNDFLKKRNKSLQEHVLKNYKPPKIFIGFDTSSNLIFEKWKGQSKLVLDMTIAAPQYKKKLAEEYNLSQSNVENLVRGDDMWYDVYKKEVELADYILCGSDFVKQSCIYLGAPEEKLKVIPYGANLEKFVPLVMPENRPEKPLKIAFVGNVSYRKGADVLLRVWEKVVKKYSHAELHFYGNLQIDTEGYNLQNVFFHGFVLQSQLVKELSECHISLLPTFFEGSSYAIYQSMALGLAVVTTPNCGSVVENMQNGVLIEYGSETQIFNALSLLIEDKDLRVRLSKAAMKDIKDFTWQTYGKKLKDFLCNL